MRVSTITLATALALSSAGAMAQSGGDSSAGMVAGPATRLAMNSMHRRHYYRQGWSSDRYNGHGINSLGVTTNQGRKYNGEIGTAVTPFKKVSESTVRTSTKRTPSAMWRVPAGG